MRTGLEWLRIIGVLDVYDAMKHGRASRNSDTEESDAEYAELAVGVHGCEVRVSDRTGVR